MQQGNKIMLVLGIIAIAAGIFVWFEASSFQKKAKLTEGKVVYVMGRTYRIRYVTEDGTEKIKQGSWKTNSFREGQSVKVWFRPDNPDRARLTDGKKGAKKILIIGGFAILMGIYPLLLRKKGPPGAWNPESETI
jgi:hypothetical protein